MLIYFTSLALLIVDLSETGTNSTESNWRRIWWSDTGRPPECAAD